MTERVSLREAVGHGAADTLFFGRWFFPDSFPQESPDFHRELLTLLEYRGNRFVAVKVFRGGAKTTLLRVFTAKRIAYGISRTVLFVSQSQKHAVESVRWLKTQVETNEEFVRAFGLSQGPKWTDEHIEIDSSLTGVRIAILALGITGQIRGININNSRPDLVVADDIVDEENSATPEQREKISNLFFGALAKSLTPESENMDSKMVLLQTPLNREDIIERCVRDGQWASAEYGCFDLGGQSRWQERFATDMLNKDREAHISRNQLSLWLREMECVVISPETSAFKPDWLQTYAVLPEKLCYYIGVDPTPPPREAEQAGASRNRDDAAIVVIGTGERGRIYIASYYLAKSPDPEEFITTLFNLVRQYRPLCVGFESVLFARTMKHYIEKEMFRRRQYFLLRSFEDRRKKSLRITQALTERASNRLIHAHASHKEFIDQWAHYPNTNHDDILDALSIAIECIDPGLDMPELQDESSIEALPEWRRAP